MLILSAFENENQRPTGSRAPNTPPFTSCSGACARCKVARTSCSGACARCKVACTSCSGACARCNGTRARCKIARARCKTARARCNGTRARDFRKLLGGARFDAERRAEVERVEAEDIRRPGCRLPPMVLTHRSNGPD